MKNEIAIMKNVSEMPVIIPEKMDKKQLFNAIQDTAPVADLVGKKFAITGILPEMVEVPKNNKDELSAVEDEDGETVMVSRLRITLITDIGAFHSFSVTLNTALMKMLNVFRDAYKDMTFEIISKTRGSGKEVKAYYILKTL